MKSTSKFIVLISIVILAGFFIKADNVTDNTKKTPIKTHNNTSPYYEIKALKLPDHMDFAGESAPLDDPDVHERIDRELLVNTYWQSNALLLFKRAHKFFPVIEPILAQKGVPDDFKYLALIESGLQNVTSPSGAKGFWQILKATAKEAHLEVNDNVDERYHLEKATEAACDYLLKSHENFGSWSLAAAAYNAGNRRIRENMNTQKADNYYDLLLNDETARYIPRILAVKEILMHPSEYGFSFDEEDLYNLEPTYTVEVDTVINNMANFAMHFGMNYKELKRHNPWLREDHLNNKSRKKYYIKIKR